MSRRNIGLGLLSVISIMTLSAHAAPQINLGNLPAGKKVTISYDVTINSDTPGNEVSSQAVVTGDNFADVSSDDPDTVALADVTITTVDAANTSLQLIASDTTPTISENVTFTATVDTTDSSLETPTGNVEFRIDGGSATVVALDASGVATYDSAFSTGNYNVTADYIGNTENKSSSNNINVLTSAANTTTNITAVSPSSSYPGDTVTVNYAVTVDPVAGGIPVSGTVEVTDGVDSCTASASAGSCMLQFTTPGNKDLIATFTSGSTELNNSASAVYTVTAINNAPVLSAIGNQTIEATNTLTFTANATDVDPASTIFYSIGAASPVGAAINSVTGDFSWTPSEAQGGAVYTVTIIAADQYNSTDSETISIDVAELDNPPVLSNDVVSTDEDTLVTFNPFDNDTEDNSFDFSTINIVSQPSSGTLTFSTANGEMTYTPNANFNGADQAQYQVKDDAGADSNIATINFTINSVNDLPVFDSTPIMQVLEEDTYTYDIAVSDVEGDSVTLSAVSLPGWLTLSGTQLTGTPQVGDRGNYDITIEADDGTGVTEQQFTLVVTELDKPPVLSNDVVSTDEDTPVTFNPFDNDTEDNSFDFSTINIVSQPSSATLTFSTANGEMTYTPNANFNGADQAQYQVKDDAGADSNIATINFTINPVNDLPVFESLPITSVVEGEQYSYQVVASDEEGQPLILTASVLPAWLQLIGDQLVGTPVTADRGVHDVVLSVSDGEDATEQSFEVTVISVHSNDLSMTQKVDSVAPKLGEEFTLTYTITNSGPDTASNVELLIKLTGDTTIMSVDSRCQVNLLVLNCSIPSVAVDQQDDILVSLSSHSLGDIYSYAKLTSSDDADTSNNELGYGLSVTNGLMAEKADTVGEAKSQIVAVGDIDNDGDDDVVLLRGADALATVFANQGSNTFEKIFDVSGSESPVDARLDFINADSNIDLVVATDDNSPTLVFAGNGMGTFVETQQLGVSSSHAVQTGDINGDGWVDAIVLNKDSADEVYLNQDGALQLSHTLINTETSFRIALADVDKDGNVDALIAKSDGTSHFYRNDQLLDNTGTQGNYRVVETGLVSDFGIVDINGDGTKEFVTAGAINNNDLESVPVNKIYGWSDSLIEMVTFGAVDSSQVIVNDIDGDGDEDLFVANTSGFHQIYLNEDGYLAVTNKLLQNEAYTSSAWVLGDYGMFNLLLAESLSEGSALYINQGGGDFGVAETDVVLTYSANVSTVTTDGVVEAQLRVVNNGPSSAQSVTLTASINSRLNVIRFGSGSEDCTITDSALSCDIGTLMPGDSVMVPLRLLAMNVGEALIRAEVSSVVEDLNPSNNSQEVRIKVTPKRDSGGGQIGFILLLLLGLVGIRRRIL